MCDPIYARYVTNDGVNVFTVVPGDVSPLFWSLLFCSILFYSIGQRSLSIDIVRYYVIEKGALYKRPNRCNYWLAIIYLLHVR